MKQALNKDWAWIVFLLGVTAFFFWPIISGTQGYYYGDYFLQQYPWAKAYAESVRRFSLPLWEGQIGSGFPLFAEGQCGGAHPLRWFLFSTLPFSMSYHAEFVMLFLVAALSTYFYARSMGISRAGSFFSTLAFVYGSAYAGLAIGLPALRTLAHFPLILLVLEKMTKKVSWQWVVLLSMVFALAFLGGMPQMALYSLFASTLYVIYSFKRVESQSSVRYLFFFLVSIILGLALSAIQLLPTLELFKQTARASGSLEFALEKSMNPLNVSTLFWPGFGLFLGFDFYIGLLPAIFAIYSGLDMRKDKRVCFFVSFSVFFIFLSLGRFNPLYVFLLRITKLFLFRTPSKFLFYACFGLAILAGMGWDKFFSQTEKRSFTRFFKGIFIGSTFLFATANIFSRLLKGPIFSYFEKYIREHVLGKAGHPHPLDHYLNTLSEYYGLLLERTAWHDPWFLAVLALWAALCFIFFCTPIRLKKGMAAAFLLLTLWDLSHYTEISTGFLGNRRGHEWVEPDGVARFLAENTHSYKTLEVVLDSAQETPRWLPNSNLIAGYASAGIYSPLVFQSYKEYMGEVGGVDDSTGFAKISADNISRNHEKLNRLGVRYLISKQALSIEGLEKVFEEGGTLIYENKNVLPRAYFENASRESGLNIEVMEESSSRINLKVKNPKEQQLIFSQLYYPGWQATIDGQPSRIFRADGIFQSVHLPEGNHEVEWKYVPYSFMAGAGISFMSLMVCFGLFLRGAKKT